MKKSVIAVVTCWLISSTGTCGNCSWSALEPVLRVHALDDARDLLDELADLVDDDRHDGEDERGHEQARRRS